MNDTNEAPKQAPWYKILLQVYFRPSVKTYRAIIGAPGVSLSRAVMWMMVSTGIRVLVPLLLYWLSGQRIISANLQTAWRASGDMSWAMFVSSGIIAVGFTTVFFPAAAIIVDWFAQRLGGTTNMERLGFLMAAIRAPAGIADAVIEARYPSVIGLAMRLVVLLIQAFLLIVSLRAANGLSLAKATALVGIPMLVLLGVIGALMLV